MADTPKPCSARHIRKIIISIIAVLALSFAAAMPVRAHAAPVQCECVRYLREVVGIDVRGDAWTIKPNVSRDKLTEGDVLLFDYGGRGEDHAAVIISFEGSVDLGYATAPEYILIFETNYKKCTPGYRKVKWDDSSIKGGYRALSTTLLQI